MLLRSLSQSKGVNRREPVEGSLSKGASRREFIEGSLSKGQTTNKKMKVLKVENLSKLYRLGEVGTGTLSHDLNRWWHIVRGKEDPYTMVGQTNDRSKAAESDYVWALRDINFEVQQGEVLGIIGRNGAGKSTLLKILSQITSPTTGSVKSKGRIASLLEVGTGMHPEMTARENIFLNGAILGMSRKEIQQKFEEIVEFSGCAMYVDTPIKRYSSGMRVRLGFAVAAFLEPEILIVDEVLAVGDAEFQKKAIGKMKDISSGGGRTVLFVSHNMASVKSLCTRGLVLSNGMTSFMGEVDESIDFYLKMNNTKGSESLRYFNSSDFGIHCNMQIVSFGVRAGNKQFGEPILREDSVCFEVEYINHNEANKLVLRFKDDQGNFIFVTGSDTFKAAGISQKSTMEIPSYFFNEGAFFIDIQVSDGKNLLFREEDAITFSIIQERKEMGKWMGKTPGPLKPNFTWKNQTDV
jgi:lipopolysaccharide transport system ATP-binding protein